MDLGFVKESNSLWLLTSRYFPSKIGGKPAWLDLKNLPNVKDLKCCKCGEQKAFLCQIYAPIDENEDCFHRTIYVFVCRTESCYKEKNSSELVTVFRSQLNRRNDFYPYDPPEYDEKNELPDILPSHIKLCYVCGCSGPFLCSKCRKISYCCSDHQKSDWKNHKAECGKQEMKLQPNRKNETVFPEYEILIENELDEENKFDEDTSSVEDKNKLENRLEEFEKELLDDGVAGELKNISESELEHYVNNKVADKQFEKFKKEISKNCEQILRYKRNGNPLWISNCDIDKNLIKNCENCNGERIFEFQIMPQMLNYLYDDSIDWGVLAIFTCSNSCCSKDSGYFKEVVIKQDVCDE